MAYEIDSFGFGDGPTFQCDDCKAVTILCVQLIDRDREARKGVCGACAHRITGQTHISITGEMFHRKSDSIRTVTFKADLLQDSVAGVAE